jgi:hypothetical protein
MLVNVVDPEAPAATKPECGNVTGFDQPINRGRMTVQVVRELPQRYDLTPFSVVRHLSSLHHIFVRLRSRRAFRQR